MELICDRIALIQAGKLLRVGSMEELRSVRIHRIESIVRHPGRLEDLAHVVGVSEAAIEGDRVSCTVRGPVGPLLAWLTSCDAVELDSRELSLEEVFLSEIAAPTPT